MSADQSIMMSSLREEVKSLRKELKEKDQILKSFSEFRGPLVHYTLQRLQEALKEHRETYEKALQALEEKRRALEVHFLQCVQKEESQYREEMGKLEKQFDLSSPEDNCLCDQYLGFCICIHRVEVTDKGDVNMLDEPK